MKLFLPFFMCLFVNVNTSADGIQHYYNNLIVELLFDADAVFEDGLINHNYQDTLGLVQNTGGLTDNSGVHLNGHLIGKEALYVEGYNGKAIYLKDSAHISMGKDEEGHDFYRFTTMAWIKPFSYGLDSKRSEILERTNIYWMNFRADTYLFRSGIFATDATDPENSGTVWYYLDSDYQVKLNEWSHVAFVYDSIGMRIYYNGRLAGSYDINEKHLVQRNRTLSVGSRQPEGDEVAAAFFDGLMDEVRVFNTDLSQEAIQYFMNVNNPNAQKPAAPELLSAINIGVNRVEIKWIDHADNETEYLVFKSLNGVEWEQVMAMPPNTSEFVVTGLETDAKYWFKVHAIGTGGFSEPSNIVSAEIPFDDSFAPVAKYSFDGDWTNNYGTCNAYFVGTPAYVTGNFGSALDMRNNSSNYLAIPNFTYDNFTINLWVKTSDTAPGRFHWYSGWGLVDGDVGGSAADYGLSMVEDKFAFGIGKPDITLFSNTKINNNKWHMLTAVLDTTDQKISLFVNGNLEDTQYYFQNKIRSASGRLFVGKNRTVINSFFSGLIDELTVYNKAVSQDEISNLLLNTPTQVVASDIAEAFNLYPNPASSYVNIETHSNESAIQVIIHDINGIQVYSDVINTNPGINRISLNLAHGIYFVSVLSNDKREVKKLIIVN